MRTLTYTITAADEKRPVSRIVRSRLHLSYHLLAQLKLKNAIALDGEPVHANHVVHAGQLLSVRLEEVRMSEASAPPEDAPDGIIYIDEDLFIVDKVAPLPCQSTDRQRSGTLENRLAHRFRDDPNGYVFRPVNRLDKGTSGLMSVARHPHAQMLLGQQLHSDRFVREYLAIAEGMLPSEAGVIDAPIGKSDGATVRREVRDDGKSARTHYRVLARTANGLSLVQLRLESGRTHQIRVHLAYVDCPVYGDFLYGEERDELRGRFALHSHRIELDHPISGERLYFESPLPDPLRALIST